MKVFLNASNQGFPLGHKTTGLIKDLKCGGVRLDIPNGLPKERVRNLVKEIHAYDLEAVYVVGGWNWWNIDTTVEDRLTKPMADEVFADAYNTASIAQELGQNFYIEPGNEPNFMPPYYADRPKQFASMVKAVGLSLATADDLKPVEVISGGVSNVNPGDGLTYALKVAQNLYPGAILGVHPYRFNKRPLEDIGGKRVKNIANTIAAYAHGRFAVTEGGWHTAPRAKKFPLCFLSDQWSDEDVAEFAIAELNLWQDVGSELYVWYQLNDGADEKEPEHRFGIRYIDGSLKPVAHTIAEWILANG